MFFGDKSATWLLFCFAPKFLCCMIHSTDMFFLVVPFMNDEVITSEHDKFQSQFEGLLHGFTKMVTFHMSWRMY